VIVRTVSDRLRDREDRRAKIAGEISSFPQGCQVGRSRRNGGAGSAQMVSVDAAGDDAAVDAHVLAFGSLD